MKKKIIAFISFIILVCAIFGVIAYRDYSLQQNNRPSGFGECSVHNGQTLCP